MLSALFPFLSGIPLLLSQVTAHELKLEIDRRAAKGLPKLKGLIQSTPANPTGAMLTAQEVVCAINE
jgi:aspartate/methionine/tyrosine aminotransferase